MQQEIPAAYLMGQSKIWLQITGHVWNVFYQKEDSEFQLIFPVSLLFHSQMIATKNIGHS